MIEIRRTVLGYWPGSHSHGPLALSLLELEFPLAGARAEAKVINLLTGEWGTVYVDDAGVTFRRAHCPWQGFRYLRDKGYPFAVFVWGGLGWPQIGMRELFVGRPVESRPPGG